MSDVNFRALVEGVPDVVAVVDREHRYVFANAAFDASSGRSRGWLIGKRNDDVVPPEAAPMWREAIEHVFVTGTERTIERTIDTPRGARRFSARVIRLPGDLVCIATRDITELGAEKLLATAAETLPVGICVVEAPAGRVVFRNAALDRIFGADLDLRPLSRALRGEVIADEALRIRRRDGELRTVRVSASPVRGASGEITSAVATFHDITDEQRAHEAAALLAEVGAVLESFDDEMGLQRVVEAAVPVIADRASIRLEHGVAVSAGAAGDVRASITAALVARGEEIGELVFVHTTAARRFDDRDRALATELARRIGVAVDNARLFRAERAANERARRLQALTAQLAGSLAETEVVAHVVDAGRAAVGAVAGYGWLLRDGDSLELTAHVDPTARGDISTYGRIPLAGDFPVCAVVRTAQPLMFETAEALTAAFPAGVPAYRAWAIIPFVANGRAIGAASFSFERERQFSADDRALLAAITGQAALALDRCRLVADIQVARRRERELYGLAAKLSSALTPDETAHVVSDEVTHALGAYVGSTVVLVDGQGYRLARTGPLLDQRPDVLPLAMSTPSTDAIRAGELVWCPTIEAIRERYPNLEGLRAANDLASWGAVPFSFEGKIVGALAIAFRTPHALATDERELLVAAGQLAGQALERARLYDELRRSDDRLRTALHAGRAGTWSVDVRRMESRRDPSYALLLGVKPGETVAADWATAHPDDYDIARLAFERTMAEGVPYEPEVRLRKGDGTYLWTRSYGRLVHDADGPAFLTGVTVDIDAERRARLELEAAYADAREAHRRKDEFLAMLGHELRNPLAPIKTALELMDFKGIGIAQKERDVIRRQVTHLARLIDDLLDVSRITRGKVQLARSIVDLGSVLAKAIEMASPLLERRSHRLAIDVPRSGLLVDADPTRLAQVFQNLLTNAAKYTEPNGDIEVRASATEAEIVVDVRDTGIGIAPDLLPHLFELFRQGERSLDRADGGLGIGLTVARSLCELHGGSISVASDGKGRGSTFTVRLPRASGTSVPASTTGTSFARAARARRVLVVDDNIDAAVTLHELLAHLGHQPAVAHDGPSALELAATFKPEVAVLDIGLPVMDGYELARKLREQLGVGIRLVAVTGYGQESDRARAIASGFDDHVVKPIELGTFSSLLDDPE